MIYPITYKQLAATLRAAGNVFPAMLLAAAFEFLPAGPSLASDTVRVMTRNLYAGTDFAALSDAETFQELVAAAGQALLTVRANRPADRAAAVAREIVRERVDLVGIQEATILRTGPFNHPEFDPAGAFLPETEVESDDLHSLLKELQRLREPFEVVAIVPGIDGQLPAAISPTVIVDARLTTRIAIIARSRGSDLKLSNVQVQGFLRNFSIPTLGGPVLNARGWVSVDVEKNGRKFRFATTHLDVDDPAVQRVQAFEMIAGAGDTNLPVVFVGDFNVSATIPSDLTYGQFIAAGFVDAWTRKRPSDPGLTCCQAVNLLNPVSQLNRRVDLILYRGGFRVEEVELVGENPNDRFGSPRLWPSDHAGVVATLRIPQGTRSMH